MTSNPLRSESEPLTAQARPLAPDAPNGLTSGAESLMDVLANMPGTQMVIEAQCRALIAENAALTAEIKRLNRVTEVIMATSDADHERLSNLLHLTLDERNERDATIETFWCRLELAEANNCGCISIDLAKP